MADNKTIKKSDILKVLDNANDYEELFTITDKISKDAFGTKCKSIWFWNLFLAITGDHSLKKCSYGEVKAILAILDIDVYDDTHELVFDDLVDDINSAWKELKESKEQKGEAHERTCL